MGFRNLPEMKPTNKPQFAGVGFNFDDPSTGPVTSVNGETGAVVLDAADVGALPSDTSIPTKTSDLENDSGFVDSDIIAPVEATSTASQAYTVGQYFINSLGQLCRVTVDIASGGSITVGTNCVVEPVGAALTSLNSKIPSIKSKVVTLTYRGGATSPGNEYSLGAVTSVCSLSSANDFKGIQYITGGGTGQSTGAVAYRKGNNIYLYVLSGTNDNNGLDGSLLVFFV